MADLRVAASVASSVTPNTVRVALNGPSGLVREWRDAEAPKIKKKLERHAPVNHTLNAQHRGGEVGTYQRSFSWDRRGSNQYGLSMRFTNSAPHAGIVEDGRGASDKWQVFSWSELRVWYGGEETIHPGDIVGVDSTRFRQGSRAGGSGGASGAGYGSGGRGYMAEATEAFAREATQ